ALAAFLCGAACADTKPAFVVRGDGVEARYRAGKERLQRLREALRARLERDARDLLPRLERTPPPVRAGGYQIVPKLVGDPPPPAEPIRATPSRYSWPRTEQLIARQEDDVRRLEADLAAEPSAADRRATCERLVADHDKLSAAERKIDSHVSYNRLWQGAIARDPADYARNTVLADDAVEREAIR